MSTMHRFAIAALALVVFAGSAMAEDSEGWTGEVNAGVTAQTGTNDNFNGSLDAKATRTWENDVASLRFSGTYGTSRKRDQQNSNNENTDTIQDAQGLFGDWKHTFGDTFFWNSTAELSRDSVLRREVRARVDTGPGVRAWAGDAPDKEHFDLSAGIGYRYENYDGNANDPADHDEDHFVDLVAGFEYKNGLFDDKVEWTHTGSAFVPANDFQAFIIRTEGIIGIPLTEAWSFRTSFFYEYQNDVPKGVSESTTRTTVGLGYKF